MLDAQFLQYNDTWTSWEPVSLDWALRIAFIYGNRSNDEFIFEDLPRGPREYATGDDFDEFYAVRIRMFECPCEHVVRPKSVLSWLWQKVRFAWLVIRSGV